MSRAPKPAPLFPWPLLPLALLLACASGGADKPAGVGGPEASLSAPEGQVIDPTLTGGALPFTVAAPAGCAVELELWTAEGRAWPLAAFVAEAAAIFPEVVAVSDGDVIDLRRHPGGPRA